MVSVEGGTPMDGVQKSVKIAFGASFGVRKMVFGSASCCALSEIAMTPSARRAAMNLLATSTKSKAGLCHARLYCSRRPLIWSFLLRKSFDKAWTVVPVGAMRTSVGRSVCPTLVQIRTTFDLTSRVLVR